jgi:hypothetical protein
MALIIHEQSVDLIAELDRAFPARCIKHNESAIDAHRYAGRRELIDELKTHLKRATERPGVIPSVLSKRS